METVSNLLKKHRLTTEKIKEFMVTFGNIYKGSYSIIVLVNNNIRIIESNLAIQLPGNLDTSENLFFIENVLNTIEEKIHSIITLLKHDLEINNDVNKTLLLESTKLYNWIVKTVNSSIYFSEHDDLIHIFLEKLKTEELKRIEDLYSEYTNTLKLYIHYLQFVVDNTTHDNIHLIQEKIEKLKYNVINKIDIENKLYSHSLRSNLQRYNLIPIKKELTEQELINTLLHMKTNNISGGIETKIATTENVINRLERLHSIALEKKHGVFLMIRISPKPVYYNFDNKGSNEKNADKKGITNELVQRQIFVKQTTSNYTNTLNSNIKLGYKNASKWIIIRTMDNSVYDIYGNTNGIIHNKSTIDKIERGSSLLIDTYNKINSYKFASHIHQPIPIIINSDIKFISMIKNITLTLRAETERRINSGFTNLYELYNVLSGNWILDFVQYELIGELINNKETITCSVLNDTNNISVSILKFIEEEVARLDINENTFEQNTMNYIINFVKKNMYIIITKSIEKAMPINSSIYEKISLRKSLLNIN